MNILPKNDKIEKYLDELADEYKVLLYNALVSRTKPLDDLSVSELLRLDNEIKKPLFEDYQKKQHRRQLFLIAGLIYMFTGVFLYFLQKEFLCLRHYHYVNRGIPSFLTSDRQKLS